MPDAVEKAKSVIEGGADMDFTMLIPTFNRPLLLEALLHNFDQLKPPFSIVVLDSSTSDNMASNAAAISACNHLSVKHVTFHETTTLQSKCAAGIEFVGTNFLAMCPDDDILFMSGIQAAVAALEVDSDLAVCDGLFLNYAPGNERTRVSIEYDGPSILNEHPLQRISQRLDHYEATTYSVHRTNNAKAVFGFAACFETSLCWELFTTLAPLVFGKHKRLPLVFGARRAGPPSAMLKCWHPRLWFEDDPKDFEEKCREYLQRLSAFMVSAGNPASAIQLALLHLSYLRKECGSYAFDSILDPIKHSPPLSRSLVGRVERRLRGLKTKWTQRPVQFDTLEMRADIAHVSGREILRNLASLVSYRHA